MGRLLLLGAGERERLELRESLVLRQLASRRAPVPPSRSQFNLFGSFPQLREFVRTPFWTKGLRDYIVLPVFAVLLAGLFLGPQVLPRWGGTRGGRRRLRRHRQQRHGIDPLPRRSPYARNILSRAGSGPPTPP